MYRVVLSIRRLTPSTYNTHKYSSDLAAWTLGDVPVTFKEIDLDGMRACC